MSVSFTTMFLVVSTAAKEALSLHRMHVFNKDTWNLLLHEQQPGTCKQERLPTVLRCCCKRLRKSAHNRSAPNRTRAIVGTSVSAQYVANTLSTHMHSTRHTSTTRLYAKCACNPHEWPLTTLHAFVSQPLPIHKPANRDHPRDAPCTITTCLCYPEQASQPRVSQPLPHLCDRAGSSQGTLDYGLAPPKSQFRTDGALPDEQIPTYPPEAAGQFQPHKDARRVLTAKPMSCHG